MASQKPFKHVQRLRSATQTVGAQLSVTSFSKLPFELRRKIWQQFPNRPRLIEIRKTYTNELRQPITWMGGCSDPLPQTSRVCRESRAVFLEKYCLLIPYHPGDKNDHDKNVHRTQAVYVNPEIDMVYLNFQFEPFTRDHFEEVVKRFWTHLHDRIAAEIYQKIARGAYLPADCVPRRWKIRRMAFNAHTLIWLELWVPVPWAEFEGHEIVDSYFPELEEVLFVAGPRALSVANIPCVQWSSMTPGNNPKPVHWADYSKIVNPETKHDFQCWELTNSHIGCLRFWFVDAMPYKVSVAVGRPKDKWDRKFVLEKRKGTSNRNDRLWVADERSGLEMIGPVGAEMRLGNPVLGQAGRFEYYWALAYGIIL